MRVGDWFVSVLKESCSKLHFFFVFCWGGLVFVLQCGGRLNNAKLVLHSRVVTGLMVTTHSLHHTAVKVPPFSMGRKAPTVFNKHPYGIHTLL